MTDPIETAETPKKKQRTRGQKWTRRGFITAGLVAGGALAIGVALRPGDRRGKLSAHVLEGEEQLLTTWVKIAPDNTVTAIVPHSEMGQGVHTALGAMLAEEMDLDWAQMEIIEAPAESDYANHILAREFLMGEKSVPRFMQGTVDGFFLMATKKLGLQITGGSASIRFTGTAAIQTAGAAAREMLVSAAAKTWDVPVKSLTTKDSMIIHAASDRRAPYAQFALAAAQLDPNPKPALKSRADYTIMGTSVPRIDLPSKVDGTAMFGIDAKVDGMKYAAVKASPVIGSAVKSMDASEAKSMPGVIDVINMGDFVAVIADGYWQAEQALFMVDITFEASENDKVSSASIFAQYADALDKDKQKSHYKSGDAAAKLAAADPSQIIEAEYTVPFLAHATLEPMNATALVKDGKAEIWTGTQNPLGTRMDIAKALDIDMNSVTVHNHFMGGGFGRRATMDFAVQAARLSKQTGLPIKLIWSREEDTAQDHYRPSATSRFRALLGDDGLPLAWDNVYVHYHDPKAASEIPYNIANQDIRYAESPTHIRFGPWRSVDHSQHGFFTESFIDELAAKAGMDGLDYRRKLLAGKPRHLNTLNAAAKAAHWGAPLPNGQARGISIVESFGTICAQAVTVDVSSGAPKVLHVACAADAGMAVNPDGFEAQMESGIIFGLTAAMLGDIEIEDGAVVQSNFHDYEMIRMEDAPKIDVVIIQSDARLGGAGEPGTPPIAPAVANAIYAATGKRIRSLPLRNADLGV